MFKVNDRQSKILKLFLTNPGRKFRAQQIADEFDVSEKTVRNEFKDLDEWLSEESTATIVRKPSMGAYLACSDNERERLLSLLQQHSVLTNDVQQEERLFQILKLILNQNKKFTILELADRYYVSKNIIKKDLASIEQLLRYSNLTLTTKQKVGISIEGDELQRREIILRLIEFQSTKQKMNQKHISHLFDQNEYSLVEGTVRKLNLALPLPLTDDSFHTLIVHILIAIHRIKVRNQIFFSDKEFEELKDITEFKLLSTYVKPLEKIFSVRFSEHEIAYLTLRVIGSKFHSPMETSQLRIPQNVRGYVQSLNNRMTKITNTDFSSDNILTNGLLIHLKATFHRLKFDLRISNPLVDDIKKMYSYMFELVYMITTELESEYHLSLPEDEMAYLTLHYQSAFERLNSLEDGNKKALIVCSMGIGMSQLLQAKLEKQFEKLEIIECISLETFQQDLSLDGIDFVITTIPLKSNIPIPIIEISPLFFDYEQQKIENFMKSRDSKSHFPHLKRLIDRDNIYLNLDVTSEKELIELITNKLYLKKKVKKSYTKSTLLREKTSSTAIGGGIAIPHGDPKEVIEPVIAVATLKHPIQWGMKEVSLVFLMAITISDREITKNLFRDLSNLSENPEIVKSMQEQKTNEGFLLLY